jgi:hypothetical protein
MSEEVVLEVVEEVPKKVDKSKVVLDEPIVRSVSILSFRLRVLQMDLGQSVLFGVHLECASGDKIFPDYKEVLIEGDEYLAWGADDNYIVGVVKSKLDSIL